MNIKPVVILGVAVSVVTATPVLADHGYRGGAYARVVAVEPILRRVVVEQPRQACWDDVAYRSAQPGRVAASTIAGGVLGGTIGQAVGNNIGHGQSRAVLGLLGAAAGSAIANDRSRRRTGEVEVPIERCAVTYERVSQQHVAGYWVTYRYRGRLERVRTLDHPGSRILLSGPGPRPRRIH